MDHLKYIFTWSIVMCHLSDHSLIFFHFSFINFHVLLSLSSSSPSLFHHHHHHLPSHHHNQCPSPPQPPPFTTATTYHLNHHLLLPPHSHHHHHLHLQNLKIDNRYRHVVNVKSLFKSATHRNQTLDLEI